MDAEVVSGTGLLALFGAHPVLIVILIISLIFLILSLGYLLLKNAKSLKLGDFQVDFSKAESVKGDTGVNAKELMESILYVKNNYNGYLKCYYEQYNNVLNKINKYSENENYNDLLKFWRE